MRRAALAAGLVALVLPGSASAHASLSTASPDFRQRLETSPVQVVLRFSQGVQPIPDGIVVRDADGRVVSRPARLRSDERSLVAGLVPLDRGAYTVRWQTLSVSDGHVVSGLYTFGVVVDPPPPTEAPGVGGPTLVEQLVRWLAYLGLAVLIGALVFRLLALPRALPEALDRAFYALVGAATLVSLNAGVVAILLRSRAALQLPFDRFLYADLSPFVGGTRVGIAWVWMTLGFAIVAGLLTLSWLRRSRTLLWPAVLVAVTLASGFSLSGHSASEPNSSAMTVVADWMHVSAASIWIGGLVTLVVIGWRQEPHARRRTFLRFSHIAAFFVGIVLLAGVYLGLLRISAPSELWSTTYGRVLLVKLVLVGLALAWGAAHHFLVRPRLEEGGGRRGGWVGRSLVGESLVGVGLLLVAAMLVSTAPPAEPLGSASSPASAARGR